MENFRFEITKVYSGIPSPQARYLRDRMWRLNLYPPWTPLIAEVLTGCWKKKFDGYRTS